MDLFSAGLVYIARCPCIREANWAFKVASIGNINDREDCSRFVFRADAAIVGAASDFLSSRVFQTVADPFVGLRPCVLFIVGPVSIFKSAVLWATLADDDTTLIVLNLRVNHIQAFRAQTLRHFQEFPQL